MYNIPVIIKKEKLFILALLSVFTIGLPALDFDMDRAKAEENFRWGVRAFHNGYYNDSVLSLEKALSYKPSSTLTRIWLGRSLYKSGFEEAALNEWKYLLDSGQGDSLLRNRVQVISYRRELGRELEQGDRYVISNEIDANRNDYYPLKRPTSVHIRKDGTVYVVAFGSNEIVILDANNQVKDILRGGLEGFDRPFDLLEVEGRYLFISEYGRNQVVKCTLQGDKIKKFAGKGRDKGMLLGPQYLATDGKGYIYVTDWGNARVNKYDLEGNFILSFGRGITPSSRLDGPTGIAIQGKFVYVSDRRRKRIEVFDLSGNFLHSFGEDFLTGPEGMTFKNHDTLMIADGNRVLEFHLNQEIWQVLSDVSSYAKRITNLSFNPNGELYVVDFDLNKIFILSQMSSLYTGLHVEVERIVSTGFPEVFIDISVEDRSGNAIVGLQSENFTITESFREVAGLSLVLSNTDPAPIEVVVLVENSQQMSRFSNELKSAVNSIHTQLSGFGALQVISAGRKAILESDFSATRLETVRAATNPVRGFKPGWRFDLGVRMAASQLIPRQSRKYIVFLTRGQLNEDSFKKYTLAEITNYMRNNFIGFYTINFGSESIGGELAYISAETGGKNYNFFASSGIEHIISELSEQISPVYMLKFVSPSEPDFGLRYIDLQVEATLQRKSGRTESGYFAPLTH